MIVMEKSAELMAFLETCTKEERKEYFSHPENGMAFWLYYFEQNFRCLLAPFHYEWVRLVFCTNLNVLFEAFR